MSGYTMMHEHMHLDLSSIKKNPDTCLDCYQQTLEELKELKKRGVERIAEVTNIGMGRDLEYIDRLEIESGIHFVRSTGFYKDPFIPKEFSEADPAQLADRMIKEIEDGTAGMIGEFGTSKDKWTQNEQKMFKAAVLAHKATGAPVYTHTTLSTLAREQARYLTEHGVDPDKVVIGHVDLAGNLQLILDVLSYGVNVGFDTVGKNNYLPDEKRVEMIVELEKRGLTDHVVLSEDITRKSQLKAFGGIGYTYLFDEFLPMLRQAGIKESTIDQMLTKNPDRILGGCS